MRLVKRMGLVLSAVCACSAMIAMAGVTSVASAHQFLSTGMGALSVVRNQTQVFKTKFGNVECGKVLLHAEAVLNSEDQHATVLYDNCTAIGLAATISKALYLFLADGLVHITNTISITALGCNLTVKPQLVSTVLFINTGKTLELKPEVTGIAYEGSGATCSGSGTEGTYTGSTVVELAGQTISWE